eukprot:5634961-Amphidinium_carterae.1
MGNPPDTKATKTQSIPTKRYKSSVIEQATSSLGAILLVAVLVGGFLNAPGCQVGHHHDHGK